MVNISIEAKKLALQIKANEDKYVTGQLDLYKTLDETDMLYECALDEIHNKSATANKVLHDSNLMRIQSGIVKQRSKYYKPDSLVFNAVEFSSKLKLHHGQYSKKDSEEDILEDMALLWEKMGERAVKILFTVPSFNFIHGTFDADPVEVVKKKRKMKEKDKLGKETKPESIGLNDASDNQDIVISEAQRILSVLWRLCAKSDENIICYFEFITDPTSFTRTIENIFIVSLLVKEGCVRMIKDGKGLPCLTTVEDKDRIITSATVKQGIISMSMQEWKEIIKTFKFKKPLIPPRKPTRQSSES